MIVSREPPNYWHNLEANAVTLKSGARSLEFAGEDRSHMTDERPLARAGVAAIKDGTSERRTAEREKTFRATRDAQQ
jgi:hypothetical protein